MLTVSQIDTSYPFDLFSCYQWKWFKWSPQVVIWLTIRIWYFLNFLTQTIAYAFTCPLSKNHSSVFYTRSSVCFRSRKSLLEFLGNVCLLFWSIYTITIIKIWADNFRRNINWRKWFKFCTIVAGNRKTFLAVFVDSNVPTDSEFDLSNEKKVQVKRNVITPIIFCEIILISPTLSCCLPLVFYYLNLILITYF